jgi:hypothetical protein
VTPRQFLVRVVQPGLALLPAEMDSLPARVLLLAIAGQESGWVQRMQAGGPAHGYWHFELSGVRGVFAAASTAALARGCCTAVDATPDPAIAYTAICWHDALACAIARLALWADPALLPTPDDRDGSWACYLRCWRPGRPRADDWPGNHDAARAAVMGPITA